MVLRSQKSISENGRREVARDQLNSGDSCDKRRRTSGSFRQFSFLIFNFILYSLDDFSIFCFYLLLDISGWYRLFNFFFPVESPLNFSINISKQMQMLCILLKYERLGEGANVKFSK